ncbi:MAG: hypothetical protein QXX38_02445 [Candidatus Aenigmatarchaeota archaeon]
MGEIKAKCICPKHGRLKLEEITIKKGVPVCSKCSSELQFGTIKPRLNTKKNQ